MDKTPFSDKCGVLSTLWFFYRDEETDANWKNFFEYADIGLPLAYMIDEGLATITDEGEKMVTDTWEVLCKMMNIDPTAQYNTLKDMFDSMEDDDEE